MLHITIQVKHCCHPIVFLDNKSLPTQHVCLTCWYYALAYTAVLLSGVDLCQHCRKSAILSILTTSFVGMTCPVGSMDTTLHDAAGVCSPWFLHPVSHHPTCCWLSFLTQHVLHIGLPESLSCEWPNCNTWSCNIYLCRRSLCCRHSGDTRCTAASSWRSFPWRRGVLPSPPAHTHTKENEIYATVRNTDTGPDVIIQYVKRHNLTNTERILVWRSSMRLTQQTLHVIC